MRVGLTLAWPCPAAAGGTHLLPLRWSAACWTWPLSWHVPASDADAPGESCGWIRPEKLRAQLREASSPRPLALALRLAGAHGQLARSATEGMLVRCRAQEAKPIYPQWASVLAMGVASGGCAVSFFGGKWHGGPSAAGVCGAVHRCCGAVHRCIRTAHHRCCCVAAAAVVAAAADAALSAAAAAVLPRQHSPPLWQPG